MLRVEPTLALHACLAPHTLPYHPLAAPQNVKRAELEGQVVLWKRRAKRVEAARLKLTEQLAAATQQAAEAHVSSDTVRKLEAAMKRLQSQLKDSLARVQRRDDRLVRCGA